jgi:hypothetical protein
MDHMGNVDRLEVRSAEELGAEEFDSLGDVFFAIRDHRLAAPLAPIALANVLGDHILVDALPAADSVSAAGVGQAFARLLVLLLLLRIPRRQGVAGREIGGMEVENILRKRPAKRQETGHFRPGRIGDNQRVRSNIERRLRAEIVSPPADGAHVLKGFVQHVHNHAENAKHVAGLNLIFEVDHGDGFEILAHFRDCLAPIFRNKAG